MAARSRACAHWQLTEGKPAPEKPRWTASFVTWPDRADLVGPNGELPVRW